jgi:hypothetical protein
VDERGIVRLSLDGSAREDSSGTDLAYFSATSVTSDAAWILGFYEVDDEHNVVKAPVYVVDASNSLRMPIEGAPYSTRPECAPNGARAAFELLTGGGVEIGVLRIDK